MAKRTVRGGWLEAVGLCPKNISVNEFPIEAFMLLEMKNRHHIQKGWYLKEEEEQSPPVYSRHLRQKWQLGNQMYIMWLDACDYLRFLSHHFCLRLYLKPVQRIT